MPSTLKLCPHCRTAAPMARDACAACGHRYRTANPPPQPVPRLSGPPPPVPQPSSGAGISPPLEWSDAYAKGRRRMKWIWIVGGAIVLLKILGVVLPWLFLVLGPMRSELR